ncbi:MAG: group III truncated hemoglobin [Flavobacteriales bacterium]|jgi:hemoglobin|nr:group III truncated hemoglobin [Flavobacteriales bacterium]
MNDISNSDDLAFLMREFYSKLLTDKTVGYIFTDVAKLNLESHLPTLTLFWTNTLFHTGGYKANVVQVHKNLDALEPLTPKHFEQWMGLLDNTIDEHFQGELADKMKLKAKQIGMTIQAKLGHYS